ncbi:MAG TPA: flavin reductase [Verrucomicrobia bacterium]|nr:flavin reductase [Verrucomicrobiota bacterium]
MTKKTLSLSKVYGLLESGPVVLITTARGGRANVMALSWLTMIDFNPPLVGMVMGDRIFSFGALKATRECVINIPTVAIAQKVVDCGNTSGAKADKFKKFGLTPLPAARVGAPLVAECPVNLECRVVDTRMVAKYDLFILEVVKAWTDPARKSLKTLHHLGGDRFMVAGKTIRLRTKVK